MSAFYLGRKVGRKSNKYSELEALLGKKIGEKLHLNIYDVEQVEIQVKGKNKFYYDMNGVEIGRISKI